jgi:hypothetical protein
MPACTTRLINLTNIVKKASVKEWDLKLGMLSGSGLIVTLLSDNFQPIIF